MHNTLIAILISILISASITFLIIPLIKNIGLKYGLIDKPNHRKHNRNSLVRIGGLGIISGFYITFFIMLIGDFFNEISLSSFSSLWYLFIASIFIFLIGFLDDIFELPTFARLVLEILIASFVWFQGLRIEGIQIPSLGGNFSSISFSNGLSLIFTIIWIVGLINAINWMDGLDGLATGLTLIPSLFFIPLSFSINNFNSCILAAILSGCCLGFLKYNFYPAKILMGDGGSYFLGYLLAVMSLMIFNLPIENVSTNYFYIFIPFLLLSVPLLDMTNVILVRLIRGDSPFYPDRSHLHHRLIDRGLSTPAVVLTVYAISILFSLNSPFIMSNYLSFIN